MLVLTRKSQQRIRIGNNITITILKVKGNAVSLGIEAPQDVRIVRGELAQFDDTHTASSSTSQSTVRDATTDAADMAEVSTCSSDAFELETACSDSDLEGNGDEVTDRSPSHNALRAFVARRRKGKIRGGKARMRSLVA